ncbi:MAG: hypothetical protein FWC97_09120 [Treponema sp.]|nr:hypothetical protein [Treponema sp.]
MKNYIFITILATLFVSRSFAADFSLSAGAGGLFGYNFTRYSLEAQGNLSAGGPPTSSFHSVQSMDRFNFGGFIFFDATYAVFSVMFQSKISSWVESVDVTPQSMPLYRMTDNNGHGSEMSIGLSLMGKYPFTVNQRITWFPMFGVEYHFALRQWRRIGGVVYDRTQGGLPEDRDADGNPYPLSAWNSFWINVGAGLDFALSGPMFLRTELLFGFRLQTAYETGALEMTKSMFNAPDPRMSGLTGGPTLRISLGYRF